MGPQEAGEGSSAPRAIWAPMRQAAGRQIASHPVDAAQSEAAAPFALTQPLGWPT